MISQMLPRFALVTGSGRGIGRGIALELARQGCSGVAIADLRRQDAQNAAQELEAAGCRSLAVEADLTSSDQAQRAVGNALQEFGQLDILVNNAGWDRVEPFLEN